ncbi:hypothetical protein BKA64DRAFT_677927 [Cadophora sp. MPI-SDFR-AT-0126]|nr:hypothetical protein BKA64DRAFT_677927 [Leotiomycetes sp. MPI-SDFR-AT-0126]
MSHSGTDSLGIKQATFEALIRTCGFPKQVKPVLLLSQPHQSRHVHYAKDNVDPVAITLVLRAGRNSRIMTCVIRIRLSDRASVCFLSSRTEDLALDLHRKCINDVRMMEIFPGHTLTIILGRLMAQNMVWLRSCWNEVGRVENATGMQPSSWRSHAPDPEMKPGDYERILQALHDVNVNFCLAQTVMTFATQLGAFCSETLEMVASMQKTASLPHLTPGQTAELRQEIEFEEEICRHSGEKFSELRNRVQAQINVTFSLIAQRDSLIAQRDSNVGLFIAGSSTQIAKLAAQDSRSMKTITIITLTFLPLNLVTTLWSSGIFALSSDTSWKIYLASSIGFSAAVFAAWFLYNRGAGEIQRIRMEEPIRLHIPGVGYVENGRVIVNAGV